MKRTTWVDNSKHDRSIDHPRGIRTLGPGGRNISSTAGIFDSTEALGVELKNIIYQMEDPKIITSPRSDQQKTGDSPIQVHGSKKKLNWQEDNHIRRKQALPMVKCDDLDGGYEEDEEDSTIYSTSVRSVTKMRTDVVEVTLKPMENSKKHSHRIFQKPTQVTKHTKPTANPYVISHQFKERTPICVETDISSGTETNVMYIDAPVHLQRRVSRNSPPKPQAYFYEAPSIKSSDMASEYTTVDKENISPDVKMDSVSMLAEPPSSTTASTIHQHIKATQKNPFELNHVIKKRSMSFPREMQAAFKYEDENVHMTEPICQKHSNKFVSNCTCNEYDPNYKMAELYRNNSFESPKTDVAKRVSQVLEAVIDKIKGPEPAKLPSRPVGKGFYQVNVVSNPKDNKGSPPRQLIFDLIQNSTSTTPEIIKMDPSFGQGDSLHRSHNRRLPNRKHDLYRYKPLETEHVKKPSPLSRFVQKLKQSNNRKEALNKSPYRTKYTINRVPSYSDSENEIQMPEYHSQKVYKNVQNAGDASYAKKGLGKKESPLRTDIYYFDHGNAKYLRTTDVCPQVITEQMAEATEHHATKFWAEIFGMIHIGFAFVTTFFLQMFRFILYTIFRPLTIGVLQLLSDYCFKPLLAVIFNGILQPPMIFLYNIATSIRDLCEPLADSLGHFFRNLAIPIRAFRIMEFNKKLPINEV